MQKYNGENLFLIMDHCRLNNVDFQIKKDSVQGLEGIYLILSDFIKINESYVNCVLIEEL